MNAAEFATAIFGEQPPGHVCLWEMERRKSFYYKSPTNIHVDGQADIFMGVGLVSRPLDRGRPSAKDIVGIGALWLDIDIDGGPENRTGGMADLDAALTLAHAIAAPTILVHSGHGLHAWHLLADGPWAFTSRDDQDDAAQLAGRWYQAHAEHAPMCASADGKPGHLDTSTRDLARILRLPGTHNAKGGQRTAVRVLDATGPRHTLDQLRALVAGVQPPTLAARTPGGAVSVDVTAGGSGALSALQLELMLEADQDFADTFHHRRTDKPHWTMSEYDLSLASQAALAGLGDQQLADLIVAHRAHHGEQRKGWRGDYLRRTVSRARASAQARANAAVELRRLAEAGRTAA